MSEPHQPAEAGDGGRDDATAVLELRDMISQFVGERDWHQFHSPKNLSMALAIEVGELMEHFQWISTDDSRRVNQDPDKLAAIGEELADVLCYALAIANELELDVSTIMRGKMKKNRRKYPADEYQGRYGPEDDG